MAVERSLASSTVTLRSTVCELSSCNMARTERFRRKTALLLDQTRSPVSTEAQDRCRKYSNLSRVSAAAPLKRSSLSAWRRGRCVTAVERHASDGRPLYHDRLLSRSLLSLSLSLSSLRFASQGKSPQVVDPRPGAPFPDSAVEEALGSAEVGAFPPTFGLAGSVCLVGTQPSLYF